MRKLLFFQKGGKEGPLVFRNSETKRVACKMNELMNELIHHHHHHHHPHFDHHQVHHRHQTPQLYHHHQAPPMNATTSCGNYVNFDGTSRVDISEGCQEEYMTIPSGYVIAPWTDENIAMIAEYYWGTHGIFLADGTYLWGVHIPDLPKSVPLILLVLKKILNRDNVFVKDEEITRGFLLGVQL